jgi:hypothetical protein
MKTFIVAASTVVILVLGAPAYAQFVQGTYDSLAADTLDFAITTSTGPGANQRRLKLDVYMFDDGNMVRASTMGFCWNNPNLRMDSAVASPFLRDGFDYVLFLYYAGSLSQTNTSRKFLIGGASLAPPMITPAPSRQLWASYYFTATAWSSGDSVVFDTMTYNSGSSYKFVTMNWESYQPYFEGRHTVKFDCCRDRTGNIDGDPDDICDIADLSALVDYLWISFTPPPCLEEANCDGSSDGNVDISDYSALYDYLFGSYTPTALCR